MIQMGRVSVAWDGSASVFLILLWNLLTRNNVSFLPPQRQLQRANVHSLSQDDFKLSSFQEFLFNCFCSIVSSSNLFQLHMFLFGSFCSRWLVFEPAWNGATACAGHCWTMPSCKSKQASVNMGQQVYRRVCYWPKTGINLTLKWNIMSLPGKFLLEKEMKIVE